MSDMDSVKAEFLRGIVATLRDNPEWSGETIQAVAAGTDAAMSTMRERLSRKDMGMMAALVLVDSKRLSVSLKQQCGIMLANAIEGDSVLENRVLEKFGGL